MRCQTEFCLLIEFRMRECAWQRMNLGCYILRSVCGDSTWSVDRFPWYSFPRSGLFFTLSNIDSWKSSRSYEYSLNDDQTDVVLILTTH